MAGPEVPQKGVLQASGYTPVKTDLAPPIRLPETGELWAKVGDTALRAAGQLNETAKMMQASPLNPQVKAQMDAQIAASRGGIAQGKFMENLPNNLGRMLMATDAQGNRVMIAPGSITDPTTASAFQGAMAAVPGAQTKEEKEKNKPPEYNTQVQPKTESAYGGLEEKNAGTRSSATTTSEPPTPGQMANPQTSAAPTAPTTPVAFTGDDTGANTGGGGAFGGNYQFDTQPTADQTEGYSSSAAQTGAAPPQPGSMFAAKPAAPPPAAPTQQQPPADQQPSTPGTVPGSLSDQYAQAAQKQALSQWQNQNLHPVVSPRAFLTAYQENVSTKASDATYMPSAGPGGTPAFSIGMKGGGTTLLPLQQVAQTSWGGPLIAAHNASQILSHQQDQADSAQQPNISPPPPANLPPAAPTDQSQMQPTGQVSPGPTGPADQPWGPPAAPSPLKSAFSASAYNGDNGAAPGINSSALLPVQSTTTTQSGGQQPAQPVAAGQPIQPPPFDAVQARADQMGEQPSGQYKGDRRVEGFAGPYTYYRDENPDSKSKGRVYTILPGPEGHYYSQQRWYPGTNTYQNFELPDTAAREQMWEKWGKTGFLPREKIDAMTSKEMEPWLQRAWKNDTFTRSSPTDDFNNELDATEKLHNHLQQISDIEQTLADAGYPRFNSRNKVEAASKNAVVALGIPAGNMDPVTAASVKKLDQEIDAANGILKAYPKLLVSPGEGGFQETPNIHVGDWFRLGLPNVPASNILSDSAYSGGSITARAKLLDGLRQVTDARYKDLISQGQTQWMRIDPKHDANSLKIDQKIPFKDPDNHYTKHLHTVEEGDDYKEFARAHPETWFLGTDGKPYKTPPAKAFNLLETSFPAFFK